MSRQPWRWKDTKASVIIMSLLHKGDKWTESGKALDGFKETEPHILSRLFNLWTLDSCNLVSKLSWILFHGSLWHTFANSKNFGLTCKSHLVCWFFCCSLVHGPIKFLCGFVVNETTSTQDVLNNGFGLCRRCATISSWRDGLHHSMRDYNGLNGPSRRMCFWV